MNKQLLVLGVGLGLFLGFIFYRPDENLHLVVCDVGQGDGILVIKGEAQVVVDGGSGDAIISCLSDYVPFWDRQIELVVLTNGDSDHVTGLVKVLERYQVKQVMANNLYQATAKFAAFRKAVREEGVEVFAPEAGDRIEIVTGSDPAVFEVLWPEERLGDKLVWNDDRVLGANSYDKNKANEQSLVLKLEYGEFEALLTGDIGEETEQVLASKGDSFLGEVEVLKVGHHGSRYSSTEEFLGQIRPEVAVISTGRNRYGHPTQEAIERIEAVGARVLRTDQVGAVEIVSDGKKYWLQN